MACRNGAVVLLTLAVLTLATPAPATPTQLFPGVASLLGSGGSTWRSEVNLTNPGGDAQTALLEIVPRDGTAVVASRSYDLTAGHSLRIPDLYAALGATAGAGTLRVTGDVLAWVRTFNQGQQGTFGQNVPPGVSVRYTQGQTVLFPVHTPANLAQEYRSNLAIQSMDTADQQVTVVIGTGEQSYELPAGVYMQLNNVGGLLGALPGDASLQVSCTGTWAGYVSTVDPGLGDPTTVVGQPWQEWVFNDAFASYSGWSNDEHVSTPGAGFAVSGGYLLANSWGGGSAPYGPAAYRTLDRETDLGNESFSIEYYYKHHDSGRGCAAFFELTDADDTPVLSFGYGDRTAYYRQCCERHFFVRSGAQIGESPDRGTDLDGKVTLQAVGGAVKLLFNDVEQANLSMTSTRMVTRLRVIFLTGTWGGDCALDAMKIDWARMKR